LEQSNAPILMRVNNKYKIIFALLMIVVLIYIFSDLKIARGKILVILNEESGVEHFLKIPDSQFTLNFIHSVHHTPVYEIFEIDEKNNIILKETRFYSLGVGMPYSDEGGTFTNNNGEFVLNFSRKFANLCFRVSPIPQHAIEIGDKKYPLLNFAEPEQRIKIYAQDKWMLLRERFK